jgi:hypothetical protein
LKDQVSDLGGVVDQILLPVHPLTVTTAGRGSHSASDPG